MSPNNCNEIDLTSYINLEKHIFNSPSSDLQNILIDNQNIQVCHPDMISENIDIKLLINFSLIKSETCILDNNQIWDRKDLEIAENINFIRAKINRMENMTDSTLMECVKIFNSDA